MRRCLQWAILVFFFSAAFAEGSEKSKMIPFDFPNLKQEDVSLRYHKYGYYERKNPQFKFEMVFPRDWVMLRVKEPEKLPEESVPVEIGALHRYKNPKDQQSEILAALYVTAVRVPSAWSDVIAVDRVSESLLKKNKFKILHFREYPLSSTTLKDILLTYEIPKDKTYWSRFTGFKVKDETRAYLAGEKAIFYMLHLHTSEKEYMEFGAEAFYVAKVTLRLLP